MRKTLDYCVLINPTDKMSVLSLEKQHYSITKVEQTKKGFYVYSMCRKTPCFSHGDIRHFHRIYASN
jgi:hypothetical protein